jgi:hypothetical protein
MTEPQLKDIVHIIVGLGTRLGFALALIDAILSQALLASLMLLATLITLAITDMRNQSHGSKD